VASRDPEIMQLVDGELTRDEAAAAEAAIARDPALRDKADGVRELDELVRGHLELAADAAEPRFARVWEQIEKRLDHERAPVSAPVRASIPGAPTTTEEAPAGWLGRIGRFFDRRRAHIVTAVVSAGAVAAVALVLRGRGDDEAAGGGNGTIPVTPVVEHRPPEVESLDTPDGSGTVFTLEDDDGDATVIWVDSDDEVEGL
jgi:anti-sigma factor RsiW